MKSHNTLSVFLDYSQQLDKINNGDFIHFILNKEYECLYYFNSMDNYRYDNLATYLDEFKDITYQQSLHTSIANLSDRYYKVVSNGIYNAKSNQVILIDMYLYPRHNLLSKLDCHKYFKHNLANKICRIDYYNEQVALFSRYQLIICYFLFNRYTNSQMVDIINGTNIYGKKISITSVNKQIEKIKFRLNVYNREILVELLCLPQVKTYIEELLSKIL